MWIKICGMTTPAAVSGALEAGVDAVGFVFAPSPRRLTPKAAAALAQPVRGRLCCVAVTWGPTQAEVDEIVSTFAPDVLQSDVADLAQLRLPVGLAQLPVVRSTAAEPVPLPARVLFEGPGSGTGNVTDWSRAASLARRTQLVLAGGLSVANIAAALERVQPWGVDVSSSVESEPGIKSPAEIAKFVKAVRAATSVRAATPAGDRA
jgi:phosphoribosylanthranilate isomerase